MSTSLVLFALLAAPLARATDTTYAPRPFTAQVDPAFVEQTRVRAAHFLPSSNIDAPAWFDGPPLANVSEVAKYWANTFDYSRYQGEINHNFSNYITTLPPPGDKYNRTLDVHFFHQISKRDDAIPILLLHGWPSTNLEWADVIPDLVNPPNASLPAFHVVAPDIPGYGFSPEPTAPGLGTQELATAFVCLMDQLGYKRFALYSTDLGFAVARRLVPKYPERIINHVSDFYIVFPDANDTARFASNQSTPVEAAYLRSSNAFLTHYSAYAQVQSSFPLSVAYALFDSPVGFLAWMWQVVYTLSDKPLSPEQLIRHALGLYFPGPYGNIRSYKELFVDFEAFPGIKTPVPTSVLQFGGTGNGYPALANFPYVPRDWVERTANVTYFKQHATGGHFPAESEPQLWLEDMWEIFAGKA